MTDREMQYLRQFDIDADAMPADWDADHFLADLRERAAHAEAEEQDAANRWAYRDEPPFYPTEED